MEILIAVVLVVTLVVAPGVVTLLKRHYALFVAGLLLPSIIWWVAAVRLARPQSWWARRFYGDRKSRRARARYSQDAF